MSVRLKNYELTYKSIFFRGHNPYFARAGDFVVITEVAYITVLLPYHTNTTTMPRHHW